MAALTILLEVKVQSLGHNPALSFI